MLSDEEQRRLDGIEKLLQDADPSFARGFDPAIARRRLARSAETRLCLGVMLGAVVLSVGVAIMLFDPMIGSPITALGCAVLTVVVLSVRRNPPIPVA